MRTGNCNIVAKNTQISVYSRLDCQAIFRNVMRRRENLDITDTKNNQTAACGEKEVIQYSSLIRRPHGYEENSPSTAHAAAGELADAKASCDCGCHRRANATYYAR